MTIDSQRPVYAEESKESGSEISGVSPRGVATLVGSRHR